MRPAFASEIGQIGSLELSETPSSGAGRDRDRLHRRHRSLRCFFSDPFSGWISIGSRGHVSRSPIFIRWQWHKREVFLALSIIVIDKPKNLVVRPPPAIGPERSSTRSSPIAARACPASAASGVPASCIPAPQGYDRPHGRSEELLRAPRARGTVRRPWPQRRAVRARLSRLRLGRAPDRPRGTIDRPIDRHPQARNRMAVRQGGREAITHWEVLERYGTADGPRAAAGRSTRPREPVASLLLCRLETGRTHQIGCIWPRSDIPCWATRFTGRVFAPRACFCRSKPRARSRPLADRPSMPISCQSSIPRALKSFGSDRNCRPISPVCVGSWRPCRLIPARNKSFTGFIPANGDQGRVAPK